MCWHRWTVKDREILPSAFEQMAEEHTFESIDRITPSFFRKSVIVTYICDKCGREKVERL